MLPNNIPYPKHILGEEVIVYTPLPDATFTQAKITSARYTGLLGPMQWIYRVENVDRDYQENEIWSTYGIPADYI